MGLIEPHYPEAGRGTLSLPLERMLRIYFMQNWLNLLDPGPRMPYTTPSRCAAAGIELTEDVVPDELTILRFRHLLERNGLTEQIFAEIHGLLEEKRLLLKSGTITSCRSCCMGTRRNCTAIRPTGASSTVNASKRPACVTESSAAGPERRR